MQQLVTPSQQQASSETGAYDACRMIPTILNPALLTAIMSRFTETNAWARAESQGSNTGSSNPASKPVCSALHVWAQASAASRPHQQVQENMCLQDDTCDRECVCLCPVLASLHGWMDPHLGLSICIPRSVKLLAHQVVEVNLPKLMSGRRNIDDPNRPACMMKGSDEVQGTCDALSLGRFATFTIYITC